MNAPALSHPPAATRGTGPDRRWMLLNFVLGQAAWLAIVLGAARGAVLWGCALGVVVLAWHLRRVPRPVREARLLAGALLLGTLGDLLPLRLGWLHYAASGWAGWPPPWLGLLWLVFGTSINVTLRWLRGRWRLAAALGAVAGPLAFASGARLGAAVLHEPVAALALIGAQWALLLPLLVALGRCWDGVAGPPRGTQNL